MDLGTGVTLLMNGLALSAILFLLASGLTMIFGLLNVVNFAHGAFFLMGAYVGVALFRDVGLLAAVVGATLSVALLGFVTERFLMQRFYSADSVMTAHLGQLLLTLGVSLCVTEVVQIAAGPNLLPTGDLPGFLNDRIGLVGGGYVDGYRATIILVGIVVFVALAAILRRTRTGLIVRAGVEDADMVQGLRVNVRRSFTATFVIGSAMAGFAGLAAALYYRGTFVTLGEEHLVLAFGIVVLGGLGSYLGSAVGALLVGLATVFISYWWPPGQTFIVMGLLAIVLIVRPQGLFGKEVARA
jgi:branched-chain amino acid transport system permease protein